ncbi:MAG: Clp protease N-terminal domain-containing protein [Chloroflexota bacterium]
MSNFGLIYTPDEIDWTTRFWSLYQGHHQPLAEYAEQLNMFVDTWWKANCSVIERMDGAILIATPRQMESVFALAEIDYLLSLKKPIVVVMRRPCTLTQQLQDVSPPVLHVSNPNDDDALKQLVAEVKGIIDGLSLDEAPPTDVPPPPLPDPTGNPAAIKEVYGMAASAADGQQMAYAMSLFQMIANEANGELGRIAIERHQEIVTARADAYEHIKRLSSDNHPLSVDGTLRAWGEFTRVYGEEHDPDNLKGVVTATAQRYNKQMPGESNMDRFTKRARKVLAAAQNHAETQGSALIGTEHVLLALSEAEGSIAQHMLNEAKLTPETITEQIEKRRQTGDVATTQLDLSPNVKRMLEMAAAEIKMMGIYYIDTATLLLGLLRVRNCTGLQILKSQKVNVRVMQRQLRKLARQRDNEEQFAE